MSDMNIAGLLCSLRCWGKKAMSVSRHFGWIKPSVCCRVGMILPLWNCFCQGLSRGWMCTAGATECSRQAVKVLWKSAASNFKRQTLKVIWTIVKIYVFFSLYRWNWFWGIFLLCYSQCKNIWVCKLARLARYLFVGYSHWGVGDRI